MKNSSRAMLTTFGLLMVFVGPFVMAYLLFYSGYHFSAKPVNHGQLINPPVNINRLVFRTVKGRALPVSSLHGKWLMAYFAPHTCDKLCEINLYNMRQVRKALGRNQEKVDRLLLATESGAPSHFTEFINKGFQGTQLALITGREEALLAKLAGHHIGKGEMYLIDPLGNIMMRYRPKASPEGMLKDIKRLLKYSQLG